MNYCAFTRRQHLSSYLNVTNSKASVRAILSNSASSYLCTFGPLCLQLQSCNISEPSVAISCRQQQKYDTNLAAQRHRRSTRTTRRDCSIKLWLLEALNVTTLCSFHIPTWTIPRCFYYPSHHLPPSKSWPGKLQEPEQSLMWMESRWCTAWTRSWTSQQAKEM